jgi:hypothetical protein
VLDRGRKTRGREGKEKGGKGWEERERRRVGFMSVASAPPKKQRKVTIFLLPTATLSIFLT